MKITYFGHSAFLIDELLIDPFIRTTTICPAKFDDIKCKIICVTHDHHDHLGDTFEIAKNNNATVVGISDIVNKAEENKLKTVKTIITTKNITKNFPSLIYVVEIEAI